MSEETISYIHSFNSGDLLTVLPGIQNQYKRTGKGAVVYQRIDFLPDYDHKNPHPIKNEKGQQVSMNKQTFALMKPLLESQEYIHGFEIWDGQHIDFDLEDVRIKNKEVLSGGLIHYWPMLIIPELNCDLSVPWLKVEPIESNKICINFTERYRRNKIHYLFLSEHQKDLVFLGLPHEHKEFCEQWGMNIEYKQVEDFLELAKIIAGCRFFMGNQSFCWHISDALKKKRILEVCYEFPNTFPTGANGAAFLKQPQLEYLFNKYLKETK